MAVSINSSRAPEIVDYLDRMDEIAGWFERFDALVFCAIDALQRDRAIHGNLLEIGAYEGRSAILLGLLRRADEDLLVCDLFESDAAGITPENWEERNTWYQGLARARFDANVQRFLRRAPTVVVAPSSTLERAKLASGYRMVHIDGSHTHSVVKSDLELARASLGPGGVVILDDWSQPHAAGVALAVWEEFSRGDLIPLCLTRDKFYATWDPEGLTAADIERWAETEPAVLSCQHHTLGKHRVPRFNVATSLNPTPKTLPASESLSVISGPEDEAIVDACERAARHASMGTDLAPLTRLRFAKTAVLRVARLITGPQITYNMSVIEALRGLTAALSRTHERLDIVGATAESARRLTAEVAANETVQKLTAEVAATRSELDLVVRERWLDHAELMSQRALVDRLAAADNAAAEPEAS
jgi:Methyltransferase domain